MRRRDLLGGWLTAGGAAATGHAQAPRRRARIGLLLPVTPAFYAQAIATLRAALAELGHTEPEAIEYLQRYSDGDAARLPALARELVAAEVDVIVAVTTPAIRAAMTATERVPIVFPAVADAVGSGLVASLARPGGNVTGLTFLIPDLAAKQLELLTEILPGLRRAGALRGRGEGAHAFETVAAAASARGIAMRFEEASSEPTLELAVAAMVADGCEALIIVDGPTPNRHHARLAMLTAVHRLPTISTLRVYVDAGTLAAYGPSVTAMWRRAAQLVHRILRGAAPADLPVEQPTTFELIINLRTAKALGLNVPQPLLLRADEVIE